MSEPKKPARISNAPPPITPIRGGSWAPQKVQPARWSQVWRLIPSAELWQAVCLSLDIEPGKHLREDATGAHSDYSRLPGEYWDRLMVCKANVSTNGPIRPHGPLYSGMLGNPHCPVVLSEVATFAIACDWPIPDAMRALVRPLVDAVPTGQESTQTNSHLDTERKKGEPWTHETLAELAGYRNNHGTKAAAQRFKITEARVRALLPTAESPPKGHSVFTHRMK